jgi:hypothetical protein
MRKTLTLMVALALLAGLVTAVAAGAGRGERPKIRYNAADQAAAKATVVRRADLGTGVWKGGTTKPDLSPAPTCANYHPKQSDLVLTGAAETTWTSGAQVYLDSETQVLRSARMVLLDWQRTFKVPGALQCFRRVLGKALGSQAKLVLFKQVSFPHIARYAARFRLILDEKAGGRRLRYVGDVVVVGRNRSEITLTTIAPVAKQAAVAATSLRLAHALLGRARA